jgi:hypothetical protein
VRIERHSDELVHAALWIRLLLTVCRASLSAVRKRGSAVNIQLGLRSVIGCDSV